MGANKIHSVVSSHPTSSFERMAPPAIFPLQDRFEKADTRPLRSVSFDSEKFVRQKTASLFDLGKPLLKPDTVVSDLEEGEPEVFASGIEGSWKDPPSDADRICFFTARGILFTKEKGILPDIFARVADPARYPEIFAGVDEAKVVREFTPKDSELLRVYALQKSSDMQYLTEIVARDVGYGFTFAQKSLNNPEAVLKPEELFAERRTDLLKNYIGQIQAFEFANGTVIVMEMRTYAAQIPVGCGMAADTKGIPDFLGGDRGVKQRMQSWLKNLYEQSIRGTSPFNAV